MFYNLQSWKLLATILGAVLPLNILLGIFYWASWLELVCAVTETSLFRGVKHAACETVENEEEGGEKVDFGAICCELLFLQAMHELSKIDKKFCILFSDTRSILKISCKNKYGKHKPNKTLVKC